MQTVQESDHEDDRAPRSGQHSPDDSLGARDGKARSGAGACKRENSVQLL